MEEKEFYEIVNTAYNLKDRLRELKIKFIINFDPTEEMIMKLYVRKFLYEVRTYSD